MLSEGDSAPEFSLPDQEGKTHALKDYRGKWVVLYFYPKDNTPGCTQEACGFRDRSSEIGKANAVVLGVSTDSVKKHANFVAKYDLPFALLADEGRDVVNLYGVWGKKKFMGREYMGTNRVTFLIDPKGRIAKVYPKVKVASHAEEVVEELNSGPGK